MKKLSTFLCALALAGMVSAQNRQLIGDFNERALKLATEAELQSARTDIAPAANRGGGEFFCETFSNGLDGENGAWTIEDSGNNTIWMMADGNSPGGEFSTNIDPLDSPTADNGWVIFDADLYNTPISDGFEDVTGWLTSPTFDMSGLNSVVVDYYQYFRYCCFPGSPLTLEVSTDGGTSWIVFPAHGTFVPSANTQSANPLHTTVDVSCVAAGQESVMIRWGFNSVVATGYSHYFWGIDDICIYENPVANDLEVIQVFNGDVYNIWEYRVTPLEQAPTSGDGGLLVGATFRNAGNMDQTNVVVTFEVLDTDGSTVLGTFETDPFTLLAAANATECPNNLQDTTWISTGWVPDATGTYFIRASIASDATDENADNNELTKEIVYTDDEYGHDDEDALDLEIRPRENDTNFDQHGVGNFFTFPNAGSDAHGMTVRFGDNSDPQEENDPNDDGVEFVAAVYQVTDNLDNAEFIAGETYIMQEEWIDGDPIYLPFEDAEEMLQDEVYFTAVQTEGETDEELTVLAQSDSDSDNSTLVNEIGGDDLYHWFTSQTWTPAIRLILSARVGISENDMGLVDFMVSPNPAVDNAMVTFQLNVNSVVAYEVRDINGKLVSYDNMGRFAAGQHQFNLDVSNYAGGQYTVSLVLDGESLFSRKLMVGNK